MVAAWLGNDSVWMDMIYLFRMRPIKGKPWRFWRDDWGYQLYVREKNNVYLRQKLPDFNISDLYFNAPLSFISSISNRFKIAEKNGVTISLMSSDRIRTFHFKEKWERVSTFYLGIEKAKKIVSELRGDEKEFDWSAEELIKQTKRYPELKEFHGICR